MSACVIVCLTRQYWSGASSSYSRCRVTAGDSQETGQSSSHCPAHSSTSHPLSTSTLSYVWPNLTKFSKYLVGDINFNQLDFQTTHWAHFGKNFKLMVSLSVRINDGRRCGKTVHTLFTLGLLFVQFFATLFNFLSPSNNCLNKYRQLPFI